MSDAALRYDGLEVTQYRYPRRVWDRTHNPQQFPKIVVDLRRSPYLDGRHTKRIRHRYAP